MDKLDNAIANTAYILDCLRNLRSIYETGDCNNCEAKDYVYIPKVGQMVRYNCPFYVKHSDKLAHNCYDCKYKDRQASIYPCSYCVKDEYDVQPSKWELKEVDNE